MTLEQIEQSLPNGLHDATLSSFARDLEKKALVIRVSVLMGLPNDPPESRERYRDAIITFSGVKLLVAECPDASSAFLAPGAVTFYAERSKPGTFPPELEERLADGTGFYSLYVLDWESSIHLAADEVEFEWV